MANRNIIGIFSGLTIIVALIACHIDDKVGFDFYKVGDVVKLKTVSDPCTAVILEYIPMSKYRVKLSCFKYTESSTHTFIIKENEIEKRI